MRILSSAVKAAAKAQREAETASRRRLRELEASERSATRLAAAQKRADAAAEREAKQSYLEQRQVEVDGLNAALRATAASLAGVLEQTLQVDDTVHFEQLRILEGFEAFDPPVPASTLPSPPRRETYLEAVPALSSVLGLLPPVKRRHAEALARAEAKYQHALAHFESIKAEQVDEYEAAVAAARADHDKRREAFEAKRVQRNQDVDDFESAYRQHDPDAVVAYNSMVLERSLYPEGFPQDFQLAYLPESKELVVEYELPNVEIVGDVEEYSYRKSKDEVVAKLKKKADIKASYADVVAAVALRTIHEVLEADQVDGIQVVVFNGFVQTVDPATGKNIRPHLISVRTTRERFTELDLSRVDKAVCLRNLGAQVSPRPDEMQAVKPVVDFKMVDRRFVEESDVLADLESRPNLMDLNPYQFETLVSNLFNSMGLDTKLTRSSRDGGVDAVAFDTRPIVGGKVVIQAKRYRHTVGVSAVRDLYGTMLNEGANKGILVSTSSYGPDAYDFSKDKPIELVDGGGLLYLLQQQGVQARIVMPVEG